jgi:hypothetical protein
MLVYQRVHLPALLPEGQVVSVHMLRSHQAEEHAHLARPESYGWGSGSWIPWQLFFCTQIQIFGSKHPSYILYSNIQLYIEINNDKYTLWVISNRVHLLMYGLKRTRFWSLSKSQRRRTMPTGARTDCGATVYLCGFGRGTVVSDLIRGKGGKIRDHNHPELLEI